MLNRSVNLVGAHTIEAAAILGLVLGAGERAIRRRRGNLGVGVEGLGAEAFIRELNTEVLVGRVQPDARLVADLLAGTHAHNTTKSARKA